MCIKIGEVIKTLMSQMLFLFKKKGVGKYSKTLIKQVLLLLSFGLVVSCAKEVEPPELENPGPNDCKAQSVTIPVTHGECKFELKATKDGKIRTETFLDTEHSLLTGSFIGEGKWICQKGNWINFNATPALCLYCGITHSLKSCKAKLESRKN